MPLFGRKKSADPQPRSRTWEPLPPPPASGPDGLRSLADHRDYLLSCVAESMPFGRQLLDSLGLCLCEDIASPLDLPRFDNSAMDGYAVRAVDVAGATPDHPVSLPVVGEIPAGQAAPDRLPPHTAMKIMTGAALPPGADTIVPYESTDRGTADVQVREPSVVDQHVRHVGGDIRAGEALFGHGHQLGVGDLGLLAAIGRDRVLVRPRPRVVVISTGSELADPGQPLATEAQIYDSNSYLLAAAVKAAGATVSRVGHVGDDPAAVKALVSDQLLLADLVVTTGGVSQGDYDIVKAVMPELGACEFVSVAMQPGKPQGFGLIGDDRIPMMMLPGNPVSAFVSFEAFVRPVLRKLMGVRPYARPAVSAVATHDISSASGRTQLARGKVTEVDGRREVALTGGHGSHLLGQLARANALVVLPADTTRVPAGDTVEVWLLDDVRRLDDDRMS